jgi:endonuclease III
MTRQERFDKVLAYFEQQMPKAETELRYDNPYQLLVAVILSAQCTDKRVNECTPELFNEFPSPDFLAHAMPEDVFPFIKKISYPNQKAKALVGMAKMLVDEFKGVIPNDVDELQKMPGVGRKTANVIASVVYNKPTLAVDTHVFRVSARIGLTLNAKTVLATEQQLLKFIPEEKVAISHHWLILHGRYTCKAQRPICKQCGITAHCKFFEKQKNKKVK